jgi:hypothetical protein
MPTPPSSRTKKRLSPEKIEKLVTPDDASQALISFCQSHTETAIISDPHLLSRYVALVQRKNNARQTDLEVNVNELSSLVKTLQIENLSLLENLTKMQKFVYEKEETANKLSLVTLQSSTSVISLFQSRLKSLESFRRYAATANLALCISQRDHCFLALSTFRFQHPNENELNLDLEHRLNLRVLENATNDAHKAFRKAFDMVHPFETVLWIIAKAGYTKEVAPIINVSKVTRECEKLQMSMVNVKMGKKERTQLHHFVTYGLTSSVFRLFKIRGIDVNMKDITGQTPLHDAAYNGHVKISRHLLWHDAKVMFELLKA